MTSNELKDLFRTDMSDAAEPFLWSDEEVYRYLDDSQKMFCRLTDGIGDATTPEVTQIAVPVGATWLDLHPVILKIRTMNRGSDGRPLDPINFEDLAVRGIRLDGRSGPLREVIVGMEEDKLRLAQVASAADSIQLMVFRLPLVTIDGDEIVLEIPEQHHVHLLHWAKSRAYLKQDSETFDKAKSAEFEGKFRAYCGEVKIEQERKRHKVRTVRYGGI